MSAFGIFALILTTVYIIYFSVVIIRDVISSRKSAEDNSGAETFDTTFAGEQSVEVVETETGFAVGDNNVNAESVAAIESLKQEPPFSETDKALCQLWHSASVCIHSYAPVRQRPTATHRSV